MPTTDILSFREVVRGVAHAARQRLFSHIVLSLPSTDPVTHLHHYFLVFFDERGEVLTRCTDYVRELTVAAQDRDTVASPPWILLLRARMSLHNLESITFLDFDYEFDPSDRPNGVEYLELFLGITSLTLRNVSFPSNFPDITSIVAHCPSLDSLAVENAVFHGDRAASWYGISQKTRLKYLVYAGISASLQDVDALLWPLESSPSLDHITVGFTAGV